MQRTWSPLCTFCKTFIPPKISHLLAPVINMQIKFNKNVDWFVVIRLFSGALKWRQKKRWVSAKIQKKHCMKLKCLSRWIFKFSNKMKHFAIRCIIGNVLRSKSQFPLNIPSPIKERECNSIWNDLGKIALKVFQLINFNTRQKNILLWMFVWSCKWKLVYKAYHS